MIYSVQRTPLAMMAYVVPLMLLMLCAAQHQLPEQMPPARKTCCLRVTIKHDDHGRVFVAYHLENVHHGVCVVFGPSSEWNACVSDTHTNTQTQAIARATFRKWRRMQSTHAIRLVGILMAQHSMGVINFPRLLCACGSLRCVLGGGLLIASPCPQQTRTPKRDRAATRRRRQRRRQFHSDYAKNGDRAAQFSSTQICGCPDNMRMRGACRSN